MGIQRQIVSGLNICNPFKSTRDPVFRLLETEQGHSQERESQCHKKDKLARLVRTVALFVVCAPQAYLQSMQASSGTGRLSEVPDTDG